MHGCQQESRSIDVDAKSRLPYSQMEWLDLSKSHIESKQTMEKARALENGEFMNLKILFLHDNRGDLGMRAMLNAMQEGHLERLEKLILWNASSYDQLTNSEEGTESIAIALAQGKMPNLHTLDLTGFLPKLIAPRPSSQAFCDLLHGRVGPGRLRGCVRGCFGFCCCALTSRSDSKRGETLQCLFCRVWTMNAESGDAGLKKIMMGLEKSHSRLKFLNLRDNYISQIGAIYLAGLLAAGALPQLEEIDLQNNDVRREGAQAIVKAFVKNPLLTVDILLDWPDPLLKEQTSAFREKNSRLEHRLKELPGNDKSHGTISKFKWRLCPALKQPTLNDPHRYWFSFGCQFSEHDRVAEAAAATRDSNDEADSIASPPETERERIASPPGTDIEKITSPPAAGTEREEIAFPPGTDREKIANPPEIEREKNGSPLSIEKGKTVSPPGIEIKMKSLFRTAIKPFAGTPRKYVNRLVEDPTKEAQDDTDEDEGCFSTKPTNVPSDNGAATQPSSSKAVLSEEPTTASSTDPAFAPPQGSSDVQSESDQTSGKDNVHIFITASWGFIGAAKRILDQNTSNRAPSKGSSWKKPLFSVVSAIARRLLENEKRTRRQIESIILELLMLADRKPIEFHKMFGLTRVLLEESVDKTYYPAYVCDTCRQHCEASNKRCESVVQPSFLKRSASSLSSVLLQSPSKSTETSPDLTEDPRLPY